jgi:hypothetical protein
MDLFRNSIEFWATVLGTAVTVFGVIQSRALLAVIGGVIAVMSAAAFAYARYERERFRHATLTVEGRNIDSLTLAGLRRRLNRSLAIQDVRQVATVRGRDLTVTWTYSGHCRTNMETSIEFSIDTDSNIPFDELDCVAYDLVNDPERWHGIRPFLIGTDGISKKVAVPFLAPLASGHRFEVSLTCSLPGCMNSGVEYCTATMSFDQERIPLYSVKLIFDDARPDWVRVYECTASGIAQLVKDLPSDHGTPWRFEFVDNVQDISARSARIYVFRRAQTAGLSGSAGIRGSNVDAPVEVNGS